MSHGRTDLQIELCGVLMGHVYKDDYGVYLDVTDIIRGRNASEKTTSVTFTHSTWEHIHKEMEKDKYAGKRIVGWYHMHPGFGVFLSEVDLFAHKNFFNAPWQISMVVDQKAKKSGIFFWKNGDVVRVRRYWVGKTPHWQEHAESSARPRPTDRNRVAAEMNARYSDENKPKYLYDSAFQNVFVGLLIVLLCVLAYMNFMLRFENRQLLSQLDNLKIVMLKSDVSTSSQLAYSFAIRARERLDDGVPPRILIPMFLEILKVDPRHSSTYQQFLPELTAILVEESKSDAKQEVVPMRPNTPEKEKESN
jgi:proteasome lid subunit RPN8/RPN11